ncbi:fibronectin type III domain-containing protein [Actinoplanes sp. NPDC051346]|uniref:fibronectin type III domain-containing protein n=1 Tax=Actinoplanes sp. NPDC051346 TaxID=3155048 RepID=UPI00342E129B
MPIRTWGLRLAAAALIPVTLGGCEVPEALGGAGGSKDAAPAATEPTAGWILVKEGSRQDKPVPAKATPTPTPTAEPTLTPPTASPPPRKNVGTSTDPRCVGNYKPGKISGLDVEVGTTSAIVRWFHSRDSSVLKYRITSISQQLDAGEQTPLRWHEVTPGAGCATLSATLTGLRRGTSYVFSVDVVRATSWQNGTLASTVARSAVVTTR